MGGVQEEGRGGTMEKGGTRRKAEGEPWKGCRRKVEGAPWKGGPGGRQLWVPGTMSLKKEKKF